ncbi:MAG TPA: DUF294 nucleotidyltransferase-like domain-containing protein [Planctomycetota bacterium]|nr:DUF294 nucleotidyltransferase-like domain-containing protein [Planctomycetota bacterium]
MNASLFSGPLPTGAPTIPPTDPFIPVEQAFNELAASASPGISVISAMKGAWAKTRAIAGDINRVQGGRAAGEALTDAADRLLDIVLRFSARRANLADAPQGIALLAMGSYGRRELAPFSDIDILLLYADGTPEPLLEQFVGTFLRPLWDSGLQIGHSVRCPRECISAMEDWAHGDSALETATSIMEARVVCGDRAFGERFINEEMPQFFKRRGRAFVDAKFEETIKRWKGLTVYRTQPNIKESPGALRDFQLALWIDRASHLSGHLPRLNSRPLVSETAIDEARNGYERLLTFRVSLHSICGRKQDVLDYQMQQAVATDLKYEGSDDLKGSERLLRDYFRAATAVHRLAQTVTRRYLEERAVASRDIERLRRRPVDDDFTRVGDYLYSSHGELFVRGDWIEAAMRAFLHAARIGISISQDMAETIRARIPSMTDAVRSHPIAAAHFKQLMKLRENVGRTLKSMRDVGLLGAYMPEFGQIEGLVINDVYHDYTVDEHTLFVVEAVDSLFKSVEPHDRFRRNVLETLAKPHLLRYACLFHDLGKSRGAPGHSERGARAVAQRAPSALVEAPASRDGDPVPRGAGHDPLHSALS